jgi:hypothetical protein
VFSFLRPSRDHDCWYEISACSRGYFSLSLTYFFFSSSVFGFLPLTFPSWCTHKYFLMPK